MRLQEKRKAAGYTQAQLSESSGVSKRAIQCYESGERDINKANATTLKRLADVLGCRMEELLEE